VWQHFGELITKPCKGFKNTKWLRHFVFWYKKLARQAFYIISWIPYFLNRL